ncbi:putative DNA binding protein [Halarchaeum rubridurum]|uniref:Bacteriocin n=1 Tax=Halarchaeum rubridurum TaxID=489911 RepID=A0A830FWA3_9EURY|nr:helix-turn-helix domain-containing protein [Halarchaeum rubridurum]MBP1953184.1 putative DNA binding protein [Halarchaeum rubridurum]GGM67199.1 bacteriocin [Halarchaeum rubridurum]
MTLVATLHLRCADFSLVTALAAAPDTTVEVEAAMADDPSRPVLFVWASGGSLDRFADALASTGDAVRVDCLDGGDGDGDGDDRRLYRVRLDPSTPSVYETALDVGACVLDVGATAEHAVFRLRFPDRDALVTFRETLVSAGIDVTTRYLGTSRDAGRETLTRKQRETLAAAVDAGYFAVPREATLADVAGTLGVSRQATSERLRRGMASLARDAVGDGTVEDAG